MTTPLALHGRSATPFATWGRRLLPPCLALLVCALLLVGLQRLTLALDYHAIIRHLRHLHRRSLVEALGGTLLSYLALVGRDYVALRHIGLRPPLANLTLGSVTGSALGNAAGFGALTGGAVRCRIFAAAGVSAAQVAQVTLLTAGTFGFALVLLSTLGAVAAAPAVAAVLGLPMRQVLAAGMLLLLGCGVALAWSALGPRQLRVWRFRIDQPGCRFILAQIGLIAIDVTGAAIVLWVLLPPTHVGFAAFLALFTVAMLLGVIAHTPGGIGVFETAMLFCLDRTVAPSAAVAALLAYRAIYFGLPLLLSAGLLGMFEARAALRGLRGVSSQGFDRVAPLFLGVITFAIGVMLVVSGATPAFNNRLALLQDTLPLWVLEGSHFLGSVLGVWLLFVARGLLQRLDAAWWAALAVAALSLLASLAKGLAFVEAGVLAFFIVLLLLTRHRFRRPASLFHAPFPFAWLVAIAIVLVVAFWILFFAFRHVPYNNDLWWQFEFDDKAPRALRATVAAALFASAVALWQTLRLAPGRTAMPSATDLRDAELIVRSQERSAAVLAMMGDKSFLFSASRNAFLMYARRGRSWVALYDPIGPRSEWPELIRSFVALAHTHGGRAAFYQVRPESLPLYLDAGLRLLKLGEEARIPLPAFGLEGSHRANLRYALKRGERDGLSAEVIEPHAVSAVLPELRTVSDAWLNGRHTKEKGFSVAGFDAAAVTSQSLMLVRQHGKAVAFAAFMTTDMHSEATVGAMRHVPHASPYAMEYLFTKLALHLKATGYTTFSLGMAPLSGLAPTPLARHWHHVAHWLWRHGGRVYNFQGLRTFKSKFGPDWEPRYLAASGNVGPFLALADIAVLAGGKTA